MFAPLPLRSATPAIPAARAEPGRTRPRNPFHPLPGRPDGQDRGGRGRARVPGPVHDPARPGARPRGDGGASGGTLLRGAGPGTGRSTRTGSWRTWPYAGRRRWSRRNGTVRNPGSMTGRCTGGGVRSRTPSREPGSSGRWQPGTTGRTRASRRGFIPSPAWLRQHDCQQALDRIPGTVEKSTGASHLVVWLNWLAAPEENFEARKEIGCAGF